MSFAAHMDAVLAAVTYRTEHGPKVPLIRELPVAMEESGESAQSWALRRNAVDAGLPAWWLRIRIFEEFVVDQFADQLLDVSTERLRIDVIFLEQLLQSGVDVWGRLECVPDSSAYFVQAVIGLGCEAQEQQFAVQFPNQGFLGHDESAAQIDFHDR